MGENSIEFGPGTLYISGPDGSCSKVSEITEMKVYDVSLVDEPADPNTYIYKYDNCLEATVEVFAKFREELLLRMMGVFDTIIDCCPNKRVVYLAKYAKKKRTRKKNWHRAIKILEDISNADS